MRPAERQKKIAALVLAEGSVAAGELARRFEVSLMTVHRDLDELERVGVVRKFRGGVTAQPSGVFESNVAFRMTAGTEEKAAIAAAAAPLVEAGMSVMFDDSTSALAVARALDDALPITVVTNFLEIITLAAARPATRLIALGGEYHSMHTSFLGVPCADAVAGLHVDLLFASVSGVAQGHVFHQEQEIVQVKRAMLRAAQRSVLLVDHTKLDRLALHRLAPLTDFDLVITDARTPKAALKTLREQHPEVTVAPLPAP